MELEKKLEKIFEKEEYLNLFKNVIKYLPNQNNKITALCELDDYIFMMKIYAPGKIVCNTDRQDGQDAPYVESEILKLLNKEFFDLTPCIPKIIYVYKMSEKQVKKNIKSIQDCVKKHTPMCDLWTAINANISTGTPTFILMEACDISFLHFCKNATTHIDFWIIKTVIWLVIYTIDIIVQKYPEFKHGDLYVRNIILHIDTDFIQKDRSAEINYVKIGNYYIPYFGMIPKIIDYELSYLNNGLHSIYKMQAETEDILQLLFSIRSLFEYKNQITMFADSLLDLNLPLNINYIEISDYIHRRGGMPSNKKLLEKIGYQKGGFIEPEKIWMEY